MQIPPYLVLFDGVCNYCNIMVNFAIKHDPKGKIKFCALQSEKGIAIKKLLNIPEDIDSVVFIDNNRVGYYSDAALGICKYLKPPVQFLYAFKIIPRFIRQPLYKWIARNRYRWFGKKESCMVPAPEIRQRFLST